MDDKTAEVIMAMEAGEPCPHFNAEDDLICPGAVLYDGQLYCMLPGFGIPLAIADLTECPQEEGD
ncbi:MAG: hypothetical protein KAR83_04945 [Thermodesulfovibrionales bacterium]|nr:hypothetical protein [Thermodesulfovibrionales bacterium]